MNSILTRFRALVLVALAIGLFAIPAHADIEHYTAVLSGANEVPPNASNASGAATISVDTETLVANWTLEFIDLPTAQTGAHFHNAPAGANGGVVFALPLGSPVNGVWNMLQADYDQLAAGNIYINVHTEEYPGGEIRGQMALETVGAEAQTLGAVKALFR